MNRLNDFSLGERQIDESGDKTRHGSRWNREHCRRKKVKFDLVFEWHIVSYIHTIKQQTFVTFLYAENRSNSARVICTAHVEAKSTCSWSDELWELIKVCKSLLVHNSLQYKHLHRFPSHTNARESAVKTARKLSANAQQFTSFIRRFCCRHFVE